MKPLGFWKDKQKDELQGILQGLSLQVEDLEELHDIEKHVATNSNVVSMVNTLSHITTDERKQLQDFLLQYQLLFNNKQAKWMGGPITFIFKKDSIPIRKAPYGIPQSQKYAVKKFIQKLVDRKIL